VNKNKEERELKEEKRNITRIYESKILKEMRSFYLMKKSVRKKFQLYSS
jgi:hypothetical protein